MSRMIRMLPDWKRVLTKAWSIKFLAASMGFTVLDIVLQFVAGARQSLLLVVLSGLCAAAAFGTRLMAQANMENWNGHEEDATKTEPRDARGNTCEAGEEA